jgi:hypothetical protein
MRGRGEGTIWSTLNSFCTNKLISQKNEAQFYKKGNSTRNALIQIGI